MARRSGPEAAPEDGHDRWLVSYADLMTLLLAFFVVLYSMSKIDADQRRLASTSIITAFGGTLRSGAADESDPAGEDSSIPREAPSPAAETPARAPERVIERRVIVEVPVRSPATARPENDAAPESAADPSARPSRKLMRAADMDRVAREIGQALEELIEEGAVEVTQHSDRMEIEIRSNLLFASGSAELAEQARPLLEKVGARLIAMGNPVSVEGFTDNVPIKTRFPSNWELAAMRAAGVTRRLEELGVDPRQLSSVGYGEQRPIADNETPEGRARNRRVVIVVMIDPPDSGSTPF